MTRKEKIISRKKYSKCYKNINYLIIQVLINKIPIKAKFHKTQKQFHTIFMPLKSIHVE